MLRTSSLTRQVTILAIKPICRSSSRRTTSSSIDDEQNNRKSRPLTVQFFTKPDCTLCFPAKRIVKKVIEELQKLISDERKQPQKIRLETIDISLEENHKWNELYKYDIPVVSIDGEFHAQHRVDEQKFRETMMKKMRE
jgi:hypothetical protein